MTSGMLTFLGVVVVALSGVAGTLGASWISKRSSERAQENESRKIDREEFDSFTRELRASLSDVRQELSDERGARQKSDRRAEQAEKRAEDAEKRVDRLAASMAAHNQWDLLILGEVRRTNPDFPGPPPFAFLDEDI